jgi:hypothetical protein
MRRLYTTASGWEAIRSTHDTLSPSILQAHAPAVGCAELGLSKRVYLSLFYKRFDRLGWITAGEIKCADQSLFIEATNWDDHW